MSIHFRKSDLIPAFLLACAPAVADPAPPQVDVTRYDRAVQFTTERIAPLGLNISIAPHWHSGPHEHFTYRREIGEERAEFISVDASSGRKEPAFNSKVIAAGLSSATGKPVDAMNLPFFDFDEVTGGIRFYDGEKTWDCLGDKPQCSDTGMLPIDPMAVASPDGKWLAYVEEGNLWVREVGGSVKFALTSDAEPRYGYATETEMASAVIAISPFRTPTGIGTNRVGPPTAKLPPAILWSPDSRMILTNRIDERQVRDRSIIQSTPTDGSLAPITWTWKSAQPNDPVLPTAEHWLFDVRARTGRKLALLPQPVTYTSAERAGEAWWSSDSRRINLMTRPRYLKSMTLNIIDVDSGKVRSPITETGETFVEMGSLGEEPLTRVLRNGDVLWFSERSGYGHLYLYDGQTGQLKRQLTDGNWTVRNILRIDESRGVVYIAGNEHEASDDPYWRKIYSVRLSDGKLNLLTPENADHFVSSPQQSAGSSKPSPETRSPADSFGFSPSGRYFIDSYGRFDQATKHVLRSAAGRVITEIEVTDVSRLTALGWRPPERFSALADDGKTPLYGMLWKPTDFDSSKRYPVLDSIYPGPQTNRVRPGFNQALQDEGNSKAWAELGIIVISVDGRGTPLRSKAFHDNSYGELANAGNLDDHVAVTRELARRFSWIDLGRVGMVGGSAGGYASAHALFTHPDFYRAGVSDAGNHDLRSMYAVWGESYIGPEVGDNYRRAVNPLLAEGLKGKLFLLHGDMDSNVLPSQTLQLADALIHDNKDFELLIAPNYGHEAMSSLGYPLRRAWDFMVRNLIGAEPPVDYGIKPSTP